MNETFCGGYIFAHNSQGSDRFVLSHPFENKVPGLESLLMYDHRSYVYHKGKRKYQNIKAITVRENFLSCDIKSLRTKPFIYGRSDFDILTVLLSRSV